MAEHTFRLFHHALENQEAGRLDYSSIQVVYCEDRQCTFWLRLLENWQNCGKRFCQSTAWYENESMHTLKGRHIRQWKSSSCGIWLHRCTLDHWIWLLQSQTLPNVRWFFSEVLVKKKPCLRYSSRSSSTISLGNFSKLVSLFWSTLWMKPKTKLLR